MTEQELRIMYNRVLTQIRTKNYATEEQRLELVAELNRIDSLLSSK